MSINLPQAPLRTAIVNPKTGQLSRDWYIWFAEISKRIGGDSFSADELAILGDFAPSQDKVLSDKHRDLEVQASFVDAPSRQKSDPLIGDLFASDQMLGGGDTLAMLAVDVQAVNLLQAVVAELQKIIDGMQIEGAFTV